jgi:hypothetical protein
MSSPRTGQRRALWPVLFIVGAVAAALLIVWAINPGTSTADFQRVEGRWRRTGEDYVLEIRRGAADGQLEASYFNPNPIAVARTQAEWKDGAIRLVVELSGGGYDGSTYTLTYDPADDILQGEYYQAKLREKYDVVFARDE